MRKTTQQVHGQYLRVCVCTAYSVHPRVLSGIALNLPRWMMITVEASKCVHLRLAQSMDE